MVIRGVADLATSSIMQVIYAQTVDSSPGTVFFVSAAFELQALLAVALLYIFIYKHEKKYGVLGKEQNKHNWNVLLDSTKAYWMNEFIYLSIKILHNEITVKPYI